MTTQQRKGPAEPAGIPGVSGVSGRGASGGGAAPAVAATPPALTIRDLPRGERPRERLASAGPQSLKASELLAILLGNGSKGENVASLSERVLAQFGGLGGLAQASFAELCQVRALGPAKTSQIMAALELARRLAQLTPEERPVISGPQDAANLLQVEMAALPQEQLRVLLLNTRNELLKIETVYIGNVNTSVVRPAEVMRAAIRHNAVALIVAHNHPSGDPAPSGPDIAITRDLVAAGKMMGIEVLDHIVIGSGQRWVSMKERSLGF